MILVRNKFKMVLMLCWVIAIIQSCQNSIASKEFDTPTTGNINIAVDETYKPIIDSELMVFSELYPHAKVNVLYMPYGDLLDAFLQDSIRLIITPYFFDEATLAPISQKLKYSPKEALLAYDAIALITNPTAGKVSMSIEELKKVLNGEITQWEQLSTKTDLSGKIGVVFDHANSSTSAFMRDSLNGGKAYSSNCYAVKSNQEVIDFVAKNSNALGVIGANWISNGNDTETQHFRDEIRAVAISSEFVGAAQPYQAYIASRQYPLKRTMRALLKEAGPGLGHGFINFIGGEQGQRIILKSGIVPATMPLRMVHIKDKI